MDKVPKIVIIPDKIIDNVPEEIKEELDDVLNKLASGEIEGDIMDLQECKIKLLCPECLGKEVSWVLNKNSSEVIFNCKSCGEKFWQTEKEYTDNIKKYPECIIDEVKDEN